MDRRTLFSAACAASPAPATLLGPYESAGAEYNETMRNSARRSFLASAVTGGLALATDPALCIAAPQLAGPDVSTSAGRLRAFMLMRAALDDRLVIGFTSGLYYGVVEVEMQPLYGLCGATFSRYRARADGGYNSASYEVAFFTDLETGKVLESFHNPYIGQDVAVPRNVTYPPAAVVISSALQLSPAKPFPGLELHIRIMPPVLSGDDIWMTEETRTSLTPASQTKPVRYSELVNLHARFSDLSSAGAKRVPCETTYASIVSWRPWLAMGDRPGHLLGSAVGRYGATLEELPAAWLAGAAKFRPDVLRNPAGPLAGLLPE